MSSLHAQLFTDVGAPLLMEQLAESVVRYPDGVTQEPETITAIVEYADHRVDFDRGRGFASRGRLHVASDQELFRGDVWRFHDKDWGTERIEPGQHGLRTVHFVRRESDHSTSDGRTVRTR